ncbi:alpha/beta-hydrolase [Periconia macrospinosa]|uniref:Alpha/beta-hydrolase n=1 Tax=Periconia macrospinosa TaxID=97972 RepID=A0A2V1DNN4_9PLEO|nr:alpha/beta-hydrolase [Periconia macrospinosa]
MSTKQMESSESKPSVGTSSIKLTTRHERSLYTYLIHTITRLFRNHLGRPKMYHPEGSIELKPNRNSRRNCTVKHRTICDINVYDILSKTSHTQSHKRRIYYFCGGGWQSPPSSQHWHLCVRMARDIPGTSVSLVSYPLAPNNSAASAFPWLLRFYRTIMQQADEVGEEVILAGDSSGGNVVLCLTLEALREDAEATLATEDKQPKSPSEHRKPSHPVALLTTCPSTDLTRSNPSINALAPLDPILTPEFVNQTARAWIGDWDASDPRVSPLNADLSLLAKSGIALHGVTAGHDILSPDGVLLRDRAAEAGVNGEWLHWEKQMHCFVLTAGYGVPEAKQAVDWTMRVLRKE